MKQPAVLFDFTPSFPPSLLLLPPPLPRSSSPILPSESLPPFNPLFALPRSLSLSPSPSFLLCPPTPPPPSLPFACEVLFVRTDSRLALNIHGDCQPVANTKAARRAPAESKPGPGSQAGGLGGHRCPLWSPPPPTPRPPPTHARTLRLVTRRRRSIRPVCTDAPVCRCTPVCARAHARTLPRRQPAPLPNTSRPRTNLTHAHICCPQGRRVTYCTLCILPALLSLPLPQMHTEYRIRICFGGGHVSPKAHAHAQQNIFF